MSAWERGEHEKSLEKATHAPKLTTDTPIIVDKHLVVLCAWLGWAREPGRKPVSTKFQKISASEKGKVYGYAGTIQGCNRLIKTS